MTIIRTSLIGLSTDQISQLPLLKQEPAFRIRQIAAWIYAKGVDNFAEMTNLTKELRRELAAAHSLARLPILQSISSSDDTAMKLLLGLADGERIEAVLLRAEGRETICISTQVGCAHGCRFCATAAMGLKRNLTSGEIVAQVIGVRDGLLEQGGTGHFNLVFMGMGEPLANYDALTHAIAVLNEDHGLAVGRRRMTISTVGLVPQIRQLATEAVTVRLALSLNATTDADRDRIMPVNRKYPIREALAALKDYRHQTGNRTTLEYVLIRGFNDRMSDARRLAEFARSCGATINLIVLNPHELSELQAPSPAAVQTFHETLLPIAPAVTLRESKGGDIKAACGQLSTAYRTESQ